jgi:hypothetical protein
MERRLASKLGDEVRTMLPTPMAAQAVLDREYLEVRAKVLELAATFDRLERGGGIPIVDGRLKLVRQGLKVLLDETSDRAEQVQLIFSRPYDDDWQKGFGMAPPAAEKSEEE